MRTPVQLRQIYSNIKPTDRFPSLCYAMFLSLPKMLPLLNVFTVVTIINIFQSVTERTLSQIHICMQFANTILV